MLHLLKLQLTMQSPYTNIIYRRVDKKKTYQYHFTLDKNGMPTGPPVLIEDNSVSIEPATDNEECSASISDEDAVKWFEENLSSGAQPVVCTTPVPGLISSTPPVRTNARHPS